MRKSSQVTLLAESWILYTFQNQKKHCHTTMPRLPHLQDTTAYHALPVPFYLCWKALAKCTKYLNGTCLECELLTITTLQNSFVTRTPQNLHVGFDDKTSRRSIRQKGQANIPGSRTHTLLD